MTDRLRARRAPRIAHRAPRTAHRAPSILARFSPPAPPPPRSLAALFALAARDRPPPLRFILKSLRLRIYPGSSLLSQPLRDECAQSAYPPFLPFPMRRSALRRAIQGKIHIFIFNATYQQCVGYTNVKITVPLELCQSWQLDYYESIQPNRQRSPDERDAIAIQM